MAPTDPQPWNPDRTWADPFIAALLLVVLVLAGTQTLRRAGPERPGDRASLEGRIQDVVLGAARSTGLASLKGWNLPGTSVATLASGRREPWDQALLAVHAGEAGDLDTGARLIQAAPGTVGDSFRQAWLRAYRGAGAAPDGAALAQVRAALGDGYAARVLAARVLARSGGDPGPLEAQAQTWATRRLVTLGALGSAGLLLALAGLSFALFLSAHPRPAPPLPRYGMSGRAVLIVFLGWFLALLAAGPAVAWVVRAVPSLKPVFLPMVYLLHAGAGTCFLLRAEGLRLGALWLRVVPGRSGRAVAEGLGYFTLAFAAVLAVSLAAGPLLPAGRSPQKELLEVLARLRGAWTVALVFGTVAVLAPVFEELMFRGFLLPWLGARLRGPRALLAAAALSGLAFAVMHMQPLGLPTLATLGIVLGLAYLRTGNLVSSILVHGLWNGGVFLLLRALS